MKNFDGNTLFMAALSAVLIASLSGFVAHHLVEPEIPADKAYVVEGVATAGEGAVTAAAAPAGPADIIPLLAAASVEEGQKVARACQVCHSFEKGGPNKVGPNLWGIMGAKHAHLPGFAYSKALEGMKDKTWDYAAMNAFLYAPKQHIPGTKMAFAGVKKDQDRANLMAWLRAQADAPIALPAGQ
ncbi:MAG: cytochrome c family protein [Alphaproteobacteria bacterium]|nr:cytochrome c family protein [Alphaproteobacteria bacterium]NDC55804.1 cytochrome c family protein [Alphaproteobacteria bacterium]NDG03810.1 cytochrome c family protein [Alphaproteobacteria bacterium]